MLAVLDHYGNSYIPHITFKCLRLQVPIMQMIVKMAFINIFCV